MRRQKCDRNLPCSRCIKRGEPEKCSREWPKEGYDPKKHRIYPRPGGPGDESPTASQGNDGSDSSPKSTPANRSDAAVHPSLRTPLTAGSITQQDVNGGAGTAQVGQKSSGVDQEKEAQVLEFLTWGRNNLSDYQVQSFDLLKEPFKNSSAYLEQEISNGFGNNHANQIAFLQLLLPKQEQLFTLVDYHIANILWYHSVFHRSFRDELQAQYKHPNGFQIRNTDLRWTALLFAIMAGSMVCAHDQETASWGFQKAERHKLTRQWYKAASTCLNLSDYMWRHHINSIQAICVLTMSGHILGFSNTQSTLLGAATKIAQGLGLQRLAAESDENSICPSDMSPAKRDKIFRLDIGRRVWAQLCTQDWFSIPFSEMYSIQKNHFSTTKPQHVDDSTFLPMPTHIPSATSFSRSINDIASIMPGLHDALTNASTLYTKYEQVLYYDAKMRALSTDGLPSFFSVRESLSPDHPEWMPWARRSLRICIAHKIIMIHRSFLGKSLTDTTFEYTRKVCMEAAKTILKEAKHAFDHFEGPNLWIDQAFMVAAGITLSLDIFHRKPTDLQYEEHRKLVETAVNMLSKFENSLIAIRGVRLLSSLLAEQARLTAAQSMNDYNRKRAREEAASDNSITLADSPQFFQAANSNFNNPAKRPKFNVPKFMENFVGGDSSFTSSLRSNHNNTTGFGPDGNDVTSVDMTINGDMSLNDGRLGNTTMQSNQDRQALDNMGFPVDSSMPEAGFNDNNTLPLDYGYETFEQIFPPQAGISNSFLFEDLLNFEL